MRDNKGLIKRIAVCRQAPRSSTFSKHNSHFLKNLSNLVKSDISAMIIYYQLRLIFTVYWITFIWTIWWEGPSFDFSFLASQSNAYLTSTIASVVLSKFIFTRPRMIKHYQRKLYFFTFVRETIQFDKAYLKPYHKNVLEPRIIFCLHLDSWSPSYPCQESWNEFENDFIVNAYLKLNTLWAVC